MKRINLLYLFIIPLAYILFQMNNKLSKASAFFYGFAENKETELSHDHDVMIYKVLVTPGQEVTKGQLLMEVRQSDVEYKLGNVQHDLERLTLMSQQQRQTLRDRIQQLEAQRKNQVNEIQTEINNLKAVIAFNQSLYKDLESIDPVIEESSNSPTATKLKALQESLTLITEPIDIEIAQLKAELAIITTPAEVQKQKLRNEQDFLKQEKEKLSILAPSDGIIGSILCKEGENISAFSSLLNFYERNPTIVKGYVHESLILQVKGGDSLQISSSLHPEHHIQGKVIGLGTRIVEIPERLRKIPEHKTYGREVLISIPAKNPFLQKEKVMLNSLNGESLNSFVFSFLPLNRKSGSQKGSTISSIK